MSRPSRRVFFASLRGRNARNAARFDADIAGRLAAPVAILAADSSGFSRKTFEHGIVRFLANMTACYAGIVPLIERHRGQVTTQNADNLLAVFTEPADAVRAALALHAWLARRNRRLDPADRFEVCVGVHYGDVLRLSDDVFGAAVNVCAKIGEDVAAANETLVSEEVARRVGNAFTLELAGPSVIGGRTFPLYRVLATA